MDIEKFYASLKQENKSTIHIQYYNLSCIGIGSRVTKIPIINDGYAYGQIFACKVSGGSIGCSKDGPHREAIITQDLIYFGLTISYGHVLV